MTKFQLASDLHIEAFNDDIKSEDFIVPYVDPITNEKCEILILAGDIGRITRFEQIKSFLKDVCSKFKLVLYVPGNQEYYKVDGMKRYTMDEINLKLKQLKKEISNLHILNRKIVIINDVCILGCTLWSYASVPVPKFIIKIPDMTTEKYNNLHKKELEFIKKGIEYAKSKNLKLLVVSHHCPSFDFIQDKTTQFSCFYASNLDYLFNDETNSIHTWVFGHCHKNFDVDINGTHFLSNQKGKGKTLADNFSKNKIFEV